MNRVACMCLTMAVLCVDMSQANAFERSGFTWANLPVTNVINTASSQELGQQTTIAAVEASYASWESPNCTRYRSEFRGDTNTAWRYQDGINTLQWIYDRNQRPRELGGAATIGVTLSVFNRNGAVDGDILFNGIDHSWTTNAVRRGQVDAQSIITHEVGHQLGLNHSPFQTATMYAAYLGGSSARTLEDDDVNGVCSLYPSGAADQCQGDDDCQDGQRCLRGSCVAGAGGGNPGNGGGGGGTIGEPCSPNGECAPGHQCVQSPDGQVFCTRGCDGGCPQGWACAQTNLGQLCIPGQGGGNAGRGFGEQCGGSQDCASGFCISDGQNAFCSQGCSSNNDCPDGARCVPTNNGGGACIPGQDGGGNNGGNAGGYGAPCMGGEQCDSQVCVGDPSTGQGYCTQVCNTAADCPDGSGCLPTQGGQSVCAPGQAPRGYGEDCEGSAQCESNVCIQSGDGGFCSQLCMDLNDCPAGSRDCVPTGNGSSVCLPGDSTSNPGDMNSGNDGQSGDGMMSGDDTNPGDATNPNGEQSAGDGAAAGPGQVPVPGTNGMGAPPLGGGMGAGAPQGPVFYEPESAPAQDGGCACDVHTDSSGGIGWLLFLGILFGGRRIGRRRP